MLTVASAPAPSGSILANESLVCVASPTWPLEPTQMAPDSLTIGIRAAASPPAIGSSGFARATRLETTTTFTMTPPVSAVSTTGLGALCSIKGAVQRKSLRFQNETLHPGSVELLRIADADLWALMLQCNRRGGATQIRVGSIVGTFFAGTLYPPLTLLPRLRGAAAS